jgi:hypothetical protein
VLLYALQILGSHIGDRLVIGSGALPQFLADVVHPRDPVGAAEILTFHASLDVDAINQEILGKRLKFVDDWVAAIPKAQLLALILMESGRLSQLQQKGNKRQLQINKEINEAKISQPDMATLLTKLAMDVATGVITSTEYQELLAQSTMDMQFAHVQALKSTKDAMKKTIFHLTNTHPIFTTGPDAAELKELFANIVIQIAETCEDDVTGEDIVQQGVNYIRLALALSHQQRVVSVDIFMISFLQFLFLLLFLFICAFGIAGKKSLLTRTRKTVAQRFSKLCTKTVRLCFEPMLGTKRRSRKNLWILQIELSRGIGTMEKLRKSVMDRFTSTL